MTTTVGGNEVAPGLHGRVAEQVALRPGVDLVALDDGGLVIRSQAWSFDLPAVEPAVAVVLAALSDHQPRPVGSLLGEVAAGGNIKHAMAMRVLLARLERMGFLDQVVIQDGVEVARLTAEGSLPWPKAPAVLPDSGELSRHLVITTESVGARMQSGASSQYVLIQDANILASLLTGHTDAVPAEVLMLLTQARLWVSAQSNQEVDSVRWSAVDRLFHLRSSDGRAVDNYGGTYRMAEVQDAPRFARGDAEDLQLLPVPDLDAAQASDPPLSVVTERRTSVREFSDEAITIDELSALLYRSCRVRHHFEGERDFDVVDRPYPSGGSIHELEVYLAITNCDGIEPGLWRYAPLEHGLVRVADQEASDRVAVNLATSAQSVTTPPVGIVLTARFDRVMWKYDSMAYALVLKHVGVLYQTLYLHADALGLGICGLGGSSSSGFDDTVGINSLAESMVGCLILGRRGGE